MKRHQIGIAGLLVCLTIAALAIASTDKPAPTKPTLAQLKTAYQKVDQELNSVWKEVKAKLEKQRFEALLWDQRCWIRYRDARAGYWLMRNYDVKVTIKQLQKTNEHWETLTGITQERIQILRSILNAQGESLTLTGVWTDGSGGIMVLSETNGKIEFNVDVCRGPTHHLGNIYGVAKKNSSIIRYSDKTTKPKEKKDVTWITCIVRNDHIELIGSNTSYYHGARAYFDGKYYRVGEVSKAARLRLSKHIKNPEDDWGISEWLEEIDHGM